MLDLSPETEALAHRVAEARKQTIDQTVREALTRQSESWLAPDEDLPKNKVEARIAAMDRIIARAKSHPDLDPRTTQEIVDDLNDI